MIFHNIESYLQVIRRRWWIIAILVACAMAVVLIINVTAKPVYRAQVKLQVLAAEPQEAFLFSQFSFPGQTDQVKASQTDFIRQLRSPFVAWQTIADLNLGIGADELLSHLSISTDGEYITVEVSADEPDVAEGIATRQTANALDQFRKTRSLPFTVLRQFLTSQLKIEEQQMLTADDAMLNFKREHSIEDYQHELLAVQDNIRSLKSQVDQAQVLEDQYTARAKEERAAAKKALDEARGAGNALLSAQALKEQAANYTAAAEQHEIDAAAQKATIDSCNKLIAQRQQELQGLLDLSPTYDALRRGQDQASGNYDFLVSKLNEATLKEAQTQSPGFVQVVEPASKPSSPAPSRLGRMAAIAALASLLAGVALAFVLEFVESLRKRPVRF